MTTETLPDTTDLAEFEFTLRCQAQTVFVYSRSGRNIPLLRCRRRAHWMTRMPCGHTALSCHRHKESLMYDMCRICHRIFYGIQFDWRRI